MALAEMDMELCMKIIIVGNGMVGKTSMMTRFCQGEMTVDYKKTIGADFMEKEIVLKESGTNVKLMMWDTAGQEMFAKLTRNYYRGASACIYVFDATDRESFLEIEIWKAKVEEQCGDIISVLVQNKCDLTDQFAVSAEEVEDLARRMGVKLYRTSVLNNVLVDDVFDYVADQYVKHAAEGGMDEPVPDIAEIANGGSGYPKNNGQKVNTVSESKSVDLNKPSKQRTGGKKNCC